MSLDTTLRRGAMLQNQARQERFDSFLDAAANECRNQAQATRDYWQQVPLLYLLAQEGQCSLADKTSKGPVDYWETSSNQDIVRVRCSDAALITGFPVSSQASASTTSIMACMELDSENMELFDGRLACADLLREINRGPLVHRDDDPFEATAKVVAAIAERQVGFRSGWQTTTGLLHDASETLVSLATNWNGSVLSLFEASLALLDDPGVVRETSLVFSALLDLS